METVGAVGEGRVKRKDNAFLFSGFSRRAICMEPRKQEKLGLMMQLADSRECLFKPFTMNCECTTVAVKRKACSLVANVRAEMDCRPWWEKQRKAILISTCLNLSIFSAAWNQGVLLYRMQRHSEAEQW